MVTSIYILAACVFLSAILSARYMFLQNKNINRMNDYFSNQVQTIKNAVVFNIDNSRRDIITGAKLIENHMNGNIDLLTKLLEIEDKIFSRVHFLESSVSAKHQAISIHLESVLEGIAKIIVTTDLMHTNIATNKAEINTKRLIELHQVVNERLIEIEKSKGIISK